ncbi:MAG: hypothetical protein JWN93_1690 [Hyphomicrobiales bacterium]|nr:hypothetical protein [Hyphomicrobiales bacterium]
MASFMTGGSLRFLYRSEEGVIDRRLWWLGLVPLASLLVVLTAIWLALAPWTGKGLDERAFLDPRTIAAYLFLMVYAFAVILITVCYVMLSMKRLRDRALPTGLAGALPLAALLDGALRWVQPQVPDVPFWLVVVCDLVLVAVVAWTVFELGLRESRRG